MYEVTQMRPIEILLVEDNPGDVRLTREALQEKNLLNNLTVAVDGVEALAMLHREGDYRTVSTPSIILLDLNLPKKDGREVLREIKTDDIVIILTTSENEEDVLNMYSLNANCYITKPVEFDKFLRVVQMIEEFWLSIVRLPTKD